MAFYDYTTKKRSIESIKKNSTNIEDLEQIDDRFYIAKRIIVND
jgi:hypothetical protein